MGKKIRKKSEVALQGLQPLFLHWPLLLTLPSPSPSDILVSGTASISFMSISLLFWLVNLSLSPFALRSMSKLCPVVRFLLLVVRLFIHALPYLRPVKETPCIHHQPRIKHQKICEAVLLRLLVVRLCSSLSSCEVSLFGQISSIPRLVKAWLHDKTSRWEGNG